MVDWALYYPPCPTKQHILDNLFFSHALSSNVFFADIGGIHDAAGAYHEYQVVRHKNINAAHLRAGCSCYGDSCHLKPVKFIQTHGVHALGQAAVGGRVNVHVCDR